MLLLCVRQQQQHHHHHNDYHPTLFEWVQNGKDPAWVVTQTNPHIYALWKEEEWAQATYVLHNKTVHPHGSCCWKLVLSLLRGPASSLSSSHRHGLLGVGLEVVQATSTYYNNDQSKLLSALPVLERKRRRERSEIAFDLKNEIWSLITTPQTIGLTKASAWTIPQLRWRPSPYSHTHHSFVGSQHA